MHSYQNFPNFRDMEKSGFHVLSYLFSWGYRNVVTTKKEIKTVADLEGLENPHHPDAGFRRRSQRDGRDRYADELSARSIPRCRLA